MTKDSHPGRANRRTAAFAFGSLPAVTGALFVGVAIGVMLLARPVPVSPMLESPVPSGSVGTHASGASRCDQCHQLQTGLSHPVGVRPKLKVPTDLPLANGVITCTTCHEDRPHSTAGLGPMLRPSLDSQAGCVTCHSPEDTKRTPHATSGKAHLSGSSAGDIRGYASGGLDAESRSCMNCHDGTTAMDAGGGSTHAFNLQSAIGAAFGDRRSEHPLGVRYDPSRSARKDIDLVPVSRLDHRVRLFDQAVGCGSCHSVYSPNKSDLVISNRGSSLCLSCHAM